jgi:hypothetical protein
VPGERVAWPIEGFDDGPVVALDRDALRGEDAVSVGRAERTVRRSLLVQARRDDDIVEDAGLTLERPERAALDQPRRHAAELVPACQATVRLHRGLEQIVRHGASGVLGFACHQIAASSCSTWAGVGRVDERDAELDGAAQHADDLVAGTCIAP